jgi:hypothetical protein
MMSEIIILMRLCSYMTMRARGAAARAPRDDTSTRGGLATPTPGTAAATRCKLPPVHTLHMMSEIIILMRLCSYMTMRARGAAARAPRDDTSTRGGLATPTPGIAAATRCELPPVHTSHMMSEIIILMRLCSYKTMRGARCCGARTSRRTSRGCNDRRGTPPSDLKGVHRSVSALHNVFGLALAPRPRVTHPRLDRRGPPPGTSGSSPGAAGGCSPCVAVTRRLFLCVIPLLAYMKL